jgi:predicted MFS family arabinose efflux permease
MQSHQNRPAWSAVHALSLGVAALTSAEMLPVSLITPIAADLGITEGLAGQTVTATALIGFLASLFTAVAARRMDRRRLMLAFSVLQVASCLLCAFAPNLALLFVGRMLLGLALGGFWAMAAAVAMRLVPAALLPKALGIIFSGVAVATVAAAPVGVFLDGLIGWRGVFLAAAALAASALAWQYMTLPSMPAQGRARLATMLHVLRRPQVKPGMLAVTLVFGGHFAFFTYLRPFLENVTAAGGHGVTAILLAFGIGSFAGTSVSGRLLARNVRGTLLSMTTLMAMIAFGLVTVGQQLPVAATLVTLWGFAFGTVPVGWSTWVAQAAPDEAESGGGILVAAIQAAMTLGAAGGGLLFNLGGPLATFSGSGGALAAAIVIIVCALRPGFATVAGPDGDIA